MRKLFKLNFWNRKRERGWGRERKGAEKEREQRRNSQGGRGKIFIKISIVTNKTLLCCLCVSKNHCILQNFMNIFLNGTHNWLTKKLVIFLEVIFVRSKFSEWKCFLTIALQILTSFILEVNDECLQVVISENMKVIFHTSYKPWKEKTTPCVCFFLSFCYTSVGRTYCNL